MDWLSNPIFCFQKWLTDAQEKYWKIKQTFSDAF